MRWITLDLGSTATKCAVMEGARLVAAQDAATPPNAAAAPLRYEIDMEAYFQQIAALLRWAGLREADGLLLSTQMHGYVLSDADFRPISPYVTWQDRLAEEALPELAQRLGADAAAPSGVPLKPNLALCMLLARIRQGEGPPQGALLHTLGGYVLGRLCGSHVCHMTNAAPTGLADVRGGGWNEALIREAGLSGLRLPRVEAALAPVGLCGRTRLYPDLGDQQVCAYGAALVPEETLHVSVGTAGLMGMLTAAWGEGAYENRPWLEPGLYLRTRSGLPGGRHLRRLHTWVAGVAEAATGRPAEAERIWHWLDHVAPLPPSPEGDILDWLDLPPERAVWRVYERIAQAYAQAARALELPVGQLAFSGGGAEKNPALRRALERALGAPGQNTARSYDVMAGMAALIKKLEDRT